MIIFFKYKGNEYVRDKVQQLGRANTIHSQFALSDKLLLLDYELDISI